MAQVGTGQYTYQQIRDFFKLPEGQSFGLVSRVAVSYTHLTLPTN